MSTGAGAAAGRAAGPSSEPTFNLLPPSAAGGSSETLSDEEFKDFYLSLDEFLPTVSFAQTRQRNAHG
jgi:hypothetical protein